MRDVSHGKDQGERRNPTFDEVVNLMRSFLVPFEKGQEKRTGHGQQSCLLHGPVSVNESSSPDLTERWWVKYYEA